MRDLEKERYEARRRVFEEEGWETPCHMGCEWFRTSGHCHHPDEPKLLVQYNRRTAGKFGEFGAFSKFLTMWVKSDGSSCPNHTYINPVEKNRPIRSSSEIRQIWAFWLEPMTAWLDMSAKLIQPWSPRKAKERMESALERMWH